MAILFKQARVFDGEKFLKGRKDVLVSAGKVAKIADKIAKSSLPAGVQQIDAGGLWLTPGFIDLHAHLREPGYMEKETILTGLMSAAKGGFVLVVSMPNTKPACDCVRDFRRQIALRDKAIKKAQQCLPYLLPACALTKSRAGKKPVNFIPLVKAGARIFTDDGSDIKDDAVLQEVFMQLQALSGIRVMFHAESEALSKHGIIHQGRVSKKLGLPAIPRLAEDVAVARAIVFAETFCVPIHITHLSSGRSVELVRRAKRIFSELGYAYLLTCDVTPHHLALTDKAVLKHGAKAKVKPPLREECDRQALIQGLLEGVIDCIATDHAPHTAEEKSKNLKDAPFGIAGFETAFAVAMDACKAWQSQKRAETVLKALTSKPSQILHKSDVGFLREGSPANITLIDPHALWTVRGEAFASKCKLTPFEGKKLRGKPVLTMLEGEIIYVAHHS